MGSDARTAGSPIIVFLRGGLEEEEEGPRLSDAGGGVTTGVDGVVPTVGGTKPWIVGVARPCGTDGVAWDERRLGAPVARGA